MQVPDSALIFDEGWFMASLRHLNLVYIDQTTSPASFERYLKALASDIDAWPEDQPRSVFYHAPEVGATVTPKRRRAAGAVLEARAAKLRRITQGYALATESRVVRGVLMAVFWVAPPPYPYKVLSCPADSMEWLALQSDGIDPKVMLKKYEELMRRYRERVQGRG